MNQTDLQEHPETSQAHVTIFTDGACSGNPGAGGWAAVLLAGTAKKEISGAVAQTTNNRAGRRAIMATFSIRICGRIYWSFPGFTPLSG